MLKALIKVFSFFAASIYAEVVCVELAFTGPNS